MDKFYLKKISIIIGAFLLIVLISSCGSVKKTKYFQDIPDSGALHIIAKAEYNEPKIQIDDILNINIQTIDPNAVANVNTGNVNVPGLSGLVSTSTSQGTTAVGNIAGYLVDKEGYVTISILGKIKVAGLTTTQARQLIQNMADKYYQKPTVTVRYANFRINVDGEVLRPGTYIVPNEKVTILDALSMAGDLTIYGRRENVLLLRENQDGTRTPYRINLKKSDFLSSPYFYLRQNDYIYIEPDKSKAAATDIAMTRNYTIIGSILSIIAIIATRK